jgi:hypothetical protein
MFLLWLSKPETISSAWIHGPLVLRTWTPLSISGISLDISPQETPTSGKQSSRRGPVPHRGMGQHRPGTNLSPCDKHASSMQCGAAESGWAHTLLNCVLDLTWLTYCYSLSSIWTFCVTVNKMASLDICVIFILDPMSLWDDPVHLYLVPPYSVLYHRVGIDCPLIWYIIVHT